MKIGIIGAGVVGGTLWQWLKENTDHVVKVSDPPRDLYDDLTGSDAIFISVPLDISNKCKNQNVENILDCIVRAQRITKNVFIRTTVSPGFNDIFGTTAMPEFLTARTAFQDFCKLPIVVGNARNGSIQEIIKDVFQGKKEIISVSNREAEIAKYAHNCFCATKVTYFNMIEKLCRDLKGTSFENVKRVANITGFIGEKHTDVPGHDGLRGFGGACFPVNISSIIKFLENENKKSNQLNQFENEIQFFKNIETLNEQYRNQK